MALQDLTPQLRTRLGRVERAVGWFVILATILMIFGFGYYVYKTAENRGWFLTKAKFFTYVDTAAGVNAGDPVYLMGFDVGRVTHIDALPAWPIGHNIYLEFEIREPYFGYLWTEGSRASVASSGFLNKRALEVTRGTGGHAIYLNFPVEEIAFEDASNHLDPKKWRLGEDIYQPATTQLVARTFWPLTNLPALAAAGKTNLVLIDLSNKTKAIDSVWNEDQKRYLPYYKTNAPYELQVIQSPALTERLDAMVQQIQAALPNFLNITNKLNAVLSNSANLTSNLNEVAANVRPVVGNLGPVVSNLDYVTAQLKHPGALGEWIIPTNLSDNLDATVGTANTNLQNLDQTLINLANLTSNLNAQVQANSNMLGSLSKIIVDSDNFVQGLKHHWLLRSAFKTKKTNAPPEKAAAPVASPKQGEEKCIDQK